VKTNAELRMKKAEETSVQAAADVKQGQAFLFIE
jgi:hypothetical protein